MAKTASGFTAETVWSGKQFANLHGGMVLIDGYVYGSDEKRAWKCFDFLTGKVAWESRKPGVGSVTFADGCLYCVSQDGGTVSLIAASPKGMQLKGQFTLPEKSRLRRQPHRAVDAPGRRQWPAVSANQSAVLLFGTRNNPPPIGSRIDGAVRIAALSRCNSCYCSFSSGHFQQNPRTEFDFLQGI